MNDQIRNQGLLSFGLWLVLGSAFVLILLIAYFFYGLQPASDFPEITDFTLKKGEGIKEIGARLSQQSLIKSIGVFKIYSIMSGKATLFKPGLYELSRDMALPEIVGILAQGNQEDVRVVVPEGLSVRDIEALLREKGVLAEDQSFSQVILAEWATLYPFLKGQVLLEGFLFPDTYRFQINSPVDRILAKFFDNFEAKAWPLLADHRQWQERLILASLLEKEVPDFNDRRLVAGILLKRLQNSWPLQVDATIVYAKCGGRFFDCAAGRVLKSDLEIASPYNTYERLGWPPTPISNPGQSAIRAALDSQSSPYWFYLSAADTGETIFSRTLDEHNENRFKHL